MIKHYFLRTLGLMTFLFAIGLFADGWNFYLSFGPAIFGLSMFFWSFDTPFQTMGKGS